MLALYHVTAEFNQKPAPSNKFISADKICFANVCMRMDVDGAPFVSTGSTTIQIFHCVIFAAYLSTELREVSTFSCRISRSDCKPTLPKRCYAHYLSQQRHTVILQKLRIWVLGQHRDVVIASKCWWSMQLARA
jgi:hypothetical protein